MQRELRLYREGWGCTERAGVVQRELILYRVIRDSTERAENDPDG